MLLKYIEVGCRRLTKARDVFLSKFDFHLVSQSSKTCKIKRNSDNFVLTEQNTECDRVINVAFSINNIEDFRFEIVKNNFKTSEINDNCQHYPDIPFIDVTSPLPYLHHRFYEHSHNVKEQINSDSNIDHILFGCSQLSAKKHALWYSKLLNLQKYPFQGSESGSMKVVVNGTGMEMFANYGNNLPIVLLSEPIIDTNCGKNQIEQFLKVNRGGGVQHIAFQTQNILETVSQLRTRGVKIIKQPYSYYALEEKRDVFEKLGLDLMVAFENSIIVDKDDDGYLLQVFTESLLDRDGLFIELIERRGCRGFGAGNIKALFSALQVDKNDKSCSATL